MQKIEQLQKWPSWKQEFTRNLEGAQHPAKTPPGEGDTLWRLWCHEPYAIGAGPSPLHKNLYATVVI